MEIRPISIRDASAFVREHHRHHKPPQGAKFALACHRSGEGQEQTNLVGVAMAGRPVARRLDNGLTLEVTRLCTDGTPNACSMLYGACRRVAKAMGYRKIITYILAEEDGTSLKASGWRITAQTEGGSWSVPSRPRTDKHPTVPKTRWECDLS